MKDKAENKENSQDPSLSVSIYSRSVISMQCKDIPDKTILQFLKDVDCRCTYGKGYGMLTVQDIMPKETPLKLQLAKMKKLVRRGLVEGCSCGCRGDFEITDKGEEYLNAL